jgi:outer membrane protein
MRRRGFERGARAATAATALTMLARAVTATAAALALMVAAAGTARAERLTVEEAVRMALASHPDVRSAEAQTRAAEDTARATRGSLLPRIGVSDEYQHWNDKFLFMGFQVREADVNTFTASVNQPLVGLLHGSQQMLADRRVADATRAGEALRASRLRERVRAGFLRTFEGRALEQIAAASQAELAEQVKIAEARLRAGVITNADLLRVTVARANARQQELLAHVQADAARADLMSAIGLPPDAAVELEEPHALLDEASAALPEPRSAAASAERRRPEMAAARALATAQEHLRRAQLFAMLPEVDLEATYAHANGQAFLPPDSAFVGVRASWPIWEWGRSFYSQRAQHYRAMAALEDVESERRRVAVEVHDAIEQSRTAGTAVDVAHTAIASAEEAYRVTNALVQAGTATTTDLLDAQSALTTARLNLTRARYAQALAHVALARTLGE